MQQAPDYSLFPNKEEWGTGDEAMDNKLSIAMKKVKDDLTLAHIQEFYRFGLSVKPRAYNPAFHTTIEFVTKAFLHNFNPSAYVDELMLKMKGEYESKVQIDFKLSDVELIKNELKSKKQYRYKGQIDFYLHQQEKAERNPFIRTSFLRSPIELHTKIIMKDFKAWLNGEKNETLFDDPFFRALRTPGQRLFIDNFAEVWYHEGQIFSLPLFS